MRFTRLGEYFLDTQTGELTRHIAFCGEYLLDLGTGELLDLLELKLSDRILSSAIARV